MTDKPLVPPKTPICQEYIFLFDQWHHAVKYETDAQFYFADRLKEHRATCELCKARMNEFNELARNAKEPETENEK
jgi:hypothetical protein